LTGIVYHNVQKFYKIYHRSLSDYADYKKQVDEWKKIYGKDIQSQDKESVYERLKTPTTAITNYPQKSRDREAR